MSREDITVIVPVRGDAQCLARLLAALGNGPDECIVVSAGEDPAVRRICEDAGARYHVAPAGRGSQQHEGALLASTSWLWFLHADALPADGAVDAIRATSALGAVGGYFRFRFQGPQTVGKRMLAAMINLRARIGVPYGDQGLFFHRDIYHDCGGFPDEPLFEEVRLVRRARKAGAFLPLSVTIDVSCRRWERDGWVRRSIANRMLAIGYAIGLSPRRLARYYDRKEEDRQRPREARQ